MTLVSGAARPHRILPPCPPLFPVVTRWTLLLTLAASGLAVLAGCLGDAPHDNPLDPLSPGYRGESVVAGRVTGLYPPFDGRGGLRVRVTPLDAPTAAERSVTTAPDGFFRVDGLPVGTYAVRAEGDGVAAAFDTVAVAVGADASVNLRVDALPVVTTQSARTVHIERWVAPESVFRLEVEATATDPDRAADLVGAALVADGLGLRMALTETAPGRFAATLDAAALPGGRVQSLLGQALRIEAVDLAGNVGVGPPLALVRVIEQTPLALRPQVNDAPPTPNPPTLEWRPEDSLPFAFTYRVDVSFVDAADVPNLVYERDGIPSTVVAHTLPDALPPGQYQWTVWVVDAAGNRSRSKPAGFRLP